MLRLLEGTPMKIVCADCGKRMDARNCDSVLIAAGVRQSDVMGEIASVSGERRRYFCGHCGGPNTKVEG